MFWDKTDGKSNLLLQAASAMHVTRHSDGIAGRETDAAIVRAHPTWRPGHRASGNSWRGSIQICLLLHKFIHPVVTSVRPFQECTAFYTCSCAAIYMTSIRVYICDTDCAKTQIQNGLHLHLFRCFICFPCGFGRNRKERSVQNLERSRSPQVHHKCCEENGENSDGSVFRLLVG